MRWQCYTNLKFNLAVPLLSLCYPVFLIPKRRILPVALGTRNPSWVGSAKKTVIAVSPVPIQFCSGSRPWYIQKNTELQMMANGCSLWRCITLQQYSNPECHRYCWLENGASMRILHERGKFIKPLQWPINQGAVEAINGYTIIYQNDIEGSYRVISQVMGVEICWNAIVRSIQITSPAASMDVCLTISRFFYEIYHIIPLYLGKL